MKLVCSIVFAGLVAIAGPARAAAPELRVSKSVIVHAAPAVVWEHIRDFDALNTWHPGVAKVEIVAGAGNAVGTERRVTLASGGVVTQKLVGFDAKHHRFRLSMLGGTFPASGYTSVLSIKAAGRNRSKVTWSGKFKRRNTSPRQAAGATDAAATAAIGAFYRVGLDSLKKIIGPK